MAKRLQRPESAATAVQSYKAGDGALLGESYGRRRSRGRCRRSRQGTGGDGHVPILVGSKVFAIYHHSQPTYATCVDAQRAICRATRRRLAERRRRRGLQQLRQQRPDVVQGSKIWVPCSCRPARRASVGLFCWDESTDSTCGYTIVERAASSSMDASARSAARTATRGSRPKGKAYCVDRASARDSWPVEDRCRPRSSPLDAVGHGRFEYFAREQRRLGRETRDQRRHRGARAVRGLDQAQNYGPNEWNLVNRHETNGAADGICVYKGDNGYCMTDGNPAAADEREQLRPLRLALLGLARSGVRHADAGGIAQSLGCRVLRLVRPGGWRHGSPCTGGDYGENGAPRLDEPPERRSEFRSAGENGVISDGSCAIALGDDNGSGQATTVDPAGAAPCVSLGSGAERTTIDMRDQRCDGTVGGAAWRNVVLTDASGNEMESVVVTVPTRRPARCSSPAR